MNSRSNKILRLEEIALNAFPAVLTEFYDGWILRYSNGYTFRGNSVNPIYNSKIEFDKKVEYCEKKYFEKKLPCVFKMTEAVSEDLDKVLADRGYTIEKSADIMEYYIEKVDYSSHSSNNYSNDSHNNSNGNLSDNLNHEEEIHDLKRLSDVKIDYEMTDEWLDNFLILNGTTDEITKDTAKSMLKNIPNKVFCASIIKDGKMAACGLGVYEEGRVGLYDIRVLEEYRRRGLATQLCSKIIYEGMKSGAESAYLQVASVNEGAIKLYDALGFTRTYTYWYRVKQSSIKNKIND